MYQARHLTDTEFQNFYASWGSPISRVLHAVALVFAEVGRLGVAGGSGNVLAILGRERRRERPRRECVSAENREPRRD